MSGCEGRCACHGVHAPVKVVHVCIAYVTFQCTMLVQW